MFNLIAVVLLFAVGIYCLLATYNLIRVLIGIEIMIKAVTLLVIFCGYQTNNLALAQAFVITVIVIEVVIMTVAVGVVVGIHRHNNTLDARNIRKLKG
ncbi:MAG: NADH-quinone oxidoreductase subunit K [Candidatus Omnitrophota bacterium]